MENQEIYRIGIITKEHNPGSPLNFAVHIDGARRNFPTHQEATDHIDAVIRGERSQGLHATKRTSHGTMPRSHR